MQFAFPLLIGREAGLERDVLNSLAVQDGSTEYDHLISMETRYSNVKDSIVELLFTLIARESGKAQRNILLTLKRDIYNDKIITKYVNVAKEYEILGILLDRYMSLASERKEAKTNFEIQFKAKLSSNINNVLEILPRHALTNGILFSSGILFDELSKGLPDVQNSTKSGRNLILTFAKYLTRSASKTSPFSSLNKIFVLERVGDEFVSVDFSGRDSRMQISNLVFHRIKEMLLANKNFVIQLEVRVNDTISSCDDEGNNIHFFVNQDNHEFFKRIIRTDVIADVLHLLRNPIKYGEYIELVASRFSQPHEVASEYLNGLIDLGIISIQFPTGIDDLNWVSSLLGFIDTHDFSCDAAVRETRLFLAYLKQTIQSLESISDVIERRRFIKHCAINITQFLNPDRELLYLNNLADSGTIFYENVFTSTHGNLKQSVIKMVENRMREVYFALNSNFIKKRNREILLEYLNKSGVTKIPLLSAYKDFYLNSDRLNRAEGPELARLNNLVDKVVAALAGGKRESSIDIFHLIESRENAEDDCIRFGAFIQTLDPNFDEIVVNSFSGGLGSNVSRYLGFCPPRIVAKCRDHISKVGVGQLFADVRDASIHNASSFPFLSKQIIDTASSSSRNSESHIPLKSLYLSIDDSNSVIIVDSAGNRIAPVNFSMEAAGRKSKLVRFLDIFNDTDLFGYTYFVQRINDFLDSSARENHVFASPRIVFKRNIILKRKQWHISSEFLKRHLDDYDGQAEIFYIRINQLLASYSIPQRVFVKFGYSSVAAKRQVDDGNKPQFIDFTSPLLTLLFMNMLGKGGQVLTFSEVLPDFNFAHDQLGNFAKEYVMSM